MRRVNRQEALVKFVDKIEGKVMMYIPIKYYLGILEIINYFIPLH